MFLIFCGISEILTKLYVLPLALWGRPQVPNCFNSMQFFGKIWQNHMLASPGGLAPSPGAHPGGPQGPGPLPLTLGFEAPKLSFFGPYLIFP